MMRISFSSSSEEEEEEDFPPEDVEDSEDSPPALPCREEAESCDPCILSPLKATAPSLIERAGEESTAVVSSFLNVIN